MWRARTSRSASMVALSRAKPDRVARGCALGFLIGPVLLAITKSVNSENFLKIFLAGTRALSITHSHLMPRETIPVSISLDKRTLQRGKRVAKERGFKHSFSALVAFLINRDAELLKKAERNGKEEPAHA